MSKYVKKTVKKKPGPKPKYHPGEFNLVEKEYHENMLQDMYDMMKQGMFDCQIYAKWEIREETFYKWRKKHPEFAEVHDRGKEQRKAVWLQKAIDAQERGDDSGFKYYIALMNNMMGWNKGEGNVQTVKNTQINIGNMNVLETQSNNELIEYIKTKINHTQIDIPLIEATIVDPDEPREEN